MKKEIKINIVGIIVFAMVLILIIDLAYGIASGQADTGRFN